MWIGILEIISIRQEEATITTFPVEHCNNHDNMVTVYLIGRILSVMEMKRGTTYLAQRRSGCRTRMTSYQLTSEPQFKGEDLTRYEMILTVSMLLKCFTKSTSSVAVFHKASISTQTIE